MLLNSETGRELISHMARLPHPGPRSSVYSNREKLLETILYISIRYKMSFYAKLDGTINKISHLGNILTATRGLQS